MSTSKKTKKEPSPPLYSLFSTPFFQNFWTYSNITGTYLDKTGTKKIIPFDLLKLMLKIQSIFQELTSAKFLKSTFKIDCDEGNIIKKLEALKEEIINNFEGIMECISEILKNSKEKNPPFTFIYQAYEVEKEEDIKSSIKDFANESKTGDTFIAFVKDGNGEYKKLDITYTEEEKKIDKNYKKTEKNNTEEEKKKKKNGGDASNKKEKIKVYLLFRNILQI